MAWDVVVIGAGAAGLMAAFTAAERGRRTLLLEKNRFPGVKILMSGGTRCNLTHHCDSRGIIDAYGDQGRFLHSALSVLSPKELVALVEAEGVATKVEETGKVFPVSDKASDIVDALSRRLSRSGATLALERPVTSLARATEGGFAVQTPGEQLHAANVIVTTGGLSYPGCGTSGDGYPWAMALGHSIVPTRPALTPIVTDDMWVKSLTGLTIPDVALKVTVAANASSPPKLAFRKTKGQKKGVVDEARSSFLFTHFGLSGPSALDVSRAIATVADPKSLELWCDFLPPVASETLDALIAADCSRDGKRQALNVAAMHAPRRLVEALFGQLQISPEVRAAEWAKRDRQRLVAAIKQCRINLAGAMGYKKAEVTAGGVSLDELDSRTMQSKIVPGLFFAGEILDLDGPIGGYNFQAAFATGKLAGLHA